jgi:murein DD-endopeptidase MepM/ murein hydrolase activator NlpD
MLGTRLAVVSILALAVAAPAEARTDRVPGLKFSGEFRQGALVVGRAPKGAKAVRLNGIPVRLAPDRRFMLAFGRDAASGARVAVTLADGSVATERRRVARRSYRVESLPTLKPPVPERMSPAELARRRIELAKLRRARAAGGDHLDWQQRFRWPARGRISGVYGSRRILGGVPGRTHYGVDVAAPVGTPVTAPAGGVVTLAEDDFSIEGGIVILDHGYGLASTFLHLSRLDVRRGERVGRGEPIGAVGSTGRATGPHLHWAVQRGRIRVDPQLLVGPMPDGKA